MLIAEMKNMIIEKVVGYKVIFTPRHYKKLCREIKKRKTSPEKLFNKIVADYLNKVNKN